MPPERSPNLPQSVVLVAAPASHALDPALCRELGRLCGVEPRVLAPGEALALVAEDEAPLPVAAIDALLVDRPVDRSILAGPPRPARLLLSDMDSTIITIECLDELADFAGRKAEVQAITRRAMNGEVPYVESLRARVAVLAGVPAGAIDEVCRERLRLVPGARTLVATMRRAGAHTALVSGGFREFTRFVRDLTGFDEDHCNTLEIRDGRLTGALLGPIIDGAGKLAVLNRLLTELGIAAGDAVCLGDGANDLPMLQAAGLSIAFRAHPRVEAATTARIRHGDLRAALYLQGYRREDLVEVG